MYLCVYENAFSFCHEISSSYGNEKDGLGRVEEDGLDGALELVKGILGCTFGELVHEHGTRVGLGADGRKIVALAVPAEIAQGFDVLNREQAALFDLLFRSERPLGQLAGRCG